MQLIQDALFERPSGNNEYLRLVCDSTCMMENHRDMSVSFDSSQGTPVNFEGAKLGGEIFYVGTRRLE